MIFKTPNIKIAVEDDIASITELLNISYRGEASKKGWTTEAGLIAGNTRTNEGMVKELIHQPGSVFLKYTKDKDEITGCVNLQPHDKKIYLGMFSVSPHLQGTGIGKEILNAAEEYALQFGCTIIYMSVISARDELISWYKRRGYADTGKRIPFEEDSVTGKHLQKLEFMVLEKSLPIFSITK